MSKLKAALRCARRCSSTFVMGLAVGIVTTPPPASAQKLVDVNYVEVVRSIWFTPVYVAMARDAFKQEGLNVSLSPAWGGEKSMAGLLGGQVDIAMQTPEAVIYVAVGRSPEKIKMIGAFDRTDGHVLMSREKISREDFKWDMLVGKKIMGKRIASTPQLIFEYAFRKNGLNPETLNIEKVASSPSRTGIWLAGQTGFDFGIFDEPHASRIVKLGKGHPVAIIGDTIGEIDFTMFAATESYIRKNPHIVQSFITAMSKTLRWMDNVPAADLAKLIVPYFPGIAEELLETSIKNYKDMKLWKADLETTPAAIDRLQDVLVGGKTLKPGDRVKYETVYDPTFARKAKELVH